MCKEKKQNDELNKKSLGKSVGTQPDNNDEKFYGIQAFDNPKDAWYVMTGLWSQNSTADEHEVYILDDEAFENVILERAIIMLGNHKLGKVTDEEFKRSLQVSGGEINDYLLDFNYFHYCSKNGKYYTSRMKFKDFLAYMWSPRQWALYRELSDTHSFKKIVAKAKRIFKKYEHYIDQDGEGGMDDMLDDLYNNGTISY